MTVTMTKRATTYDAELGKITPQDREYATEILGEFIGSDGMERIEEMAQWLRKVRYEAVISDRKRRVDPKTQDEDGGLVKRMLEALLEIRDGYGPQHGSKYCLHIANAALGSVQSADRNEVVEWAKKAEAVLNADPKDVQSLPDVCARCGHHRKQHSYNRGRYGVCGEFVSGADPKAQDKP